MGCRTMLSGYVDPLSLKLVQAKLRRVRDWTNPAIAIGLQVAANLVVRHAKAKHPRPAGRSEQAEHPYPRYYDWTGNLTGSIRAGAVRIYKDGAEIPVNAGSPTVNYAPAVELGTPRSRAFPYMRPALEENAQEFLQILGGVLRRVI